ncbi:MAG: oligosaccharide flippase family protein [Pseudomonadota bacterium]
MSFAARLARLRPTKGSLAARAIDAAGWNMVTIGTEFVFRLASNLIMTRLLVPEAFGLLAFAMVFASAVGLLADIGVYQSIVREKDRMGPRFLRVAWTVNVIRSILIALIVVALAVIFAFVGPDFAAPGSAMAAPEMPLLIALTALFPFGQGLVSTNWYAAMRRMHYKRIAFLEFITLILRLASQIGFALISPTVWALLVGGAVGNFAKAALSHLFMPGPRMRWLWDREMADHLWQYGKWIMASSGVTFIIRNTDKLIFGALISSVTMGLYAIAFIWISAAERFLDVFSRAVGFSVVSEMLRDRPDEARRLMRKYQWGIDAICVAACAALIFGGQLLVDVLYTDEYQEAGRIIQLLGPLVLAFRFNQLGNLLLVQGDTRTLFWLAVTIAVATVALLLVGYHFAGFSGGVLGMVIARFASVPVMLAKTGPFFGRRETLYDAGFGLGCVLLAVLVYVATSPA